MDGITAPLRNSLPGRLVTKKDTALTLSKEQSRINR